MDHRDDADRRWAKIVEIGCPGGCGTTVLTVELPIAMVWCSQCKGSPLFERTAT
jgi:hypothetical protein